MAGLERGVRPIGLWSMSITRSMCSRPSIRSQRRRARAAPFRCAAHGVEQGVDDQRGLAGARHAGYARQQAERDLHGDVAQVVAARPPMTRQLLVGSARRAQRRQLRCVRRPLRY